MLRSKSSYQVAVASIVYNGGTSVGIAAHLVDVPNVEEGITVLCAWEEVMTHFSRPVFGPY